MASVQQQLIFTGEIKAGAETNPPITWNNPPKHVVGLWVAPKKLEPEDLFFGKLSFQITKVESVMDQHNHFRMLVTIRNTGSYNGTCELYEYFLV